MKMAQNVFTSQTKAASFSMKIILFLTVSEVGTPDFSPDYDGIKSRERRLRSHKKKENFITEKSDRSDPSGLAGRSQHFYRLDRHHDYVEDVRDFFVQLVIADDLLAEHRELIELEERRLGAFTDSIGADVYAVRVEHVIEVVLEEHGHVVLVDADHAVVLHPEEHLEGSLEVRCTEMIDEHRLADGDLHLHVLDDDVADDAAEPQLLTRRLVHDVRVLVELIADVHHRVDHLPVPLGEGQEAFHHVRGEADRNILESAGMGAVLLAEEAPGAPHDPDDVAPRNPVEVLAAQFGDALRFHFPARAQLLEENAGIFNAFLGLPYVRIFPDTSGFYGRPGGF